MATGNNINANSSGLVKYDGAGTFSGVTVTQHDLLVGGASNGITSVAPSATSGVPVISQGSTSDPTFGTAVVAGGGTGATSFTAYSVLCGGTTSTGAVQNVSGVGSSGQILTSNGASALPTWQANSASFAPNATINLVDDFIGFINGTGQSSSNLSWSNTGGANWTFNNATTENGHPGIMLAPGTGSNPSTATLVLSNSNTTNLGNFILGGGALTLNWVIKIVTLSTGSITYTLRIGLGDTSGGAQANGCYFEYSSGLNSGNWNYVTASASSRTVTNSSTAVTTGWHNFQIVVNAGATSVSFSVDGVSLGTANTTNIPTAVVSPIIDIKQSAGTSSAGFLIADLMYLTQTLTSAR